MRALLQRVREELGMVGMAGVLLMAAALLFLAFALKPLERRLGALEDQLARGEQHLLAGSGRASANGAGKLAAFYRHFETKESATDWLARLHAIAAAAGVDMRAADYRMHKTGTRIERYEIVVPLAGSYPQIRRFLRDALSDIPVLSLDQLQIRRERAQDGRVQAEARLTLHLVQP